MERQIDHRRGDEPSKKVRASADICRRSFCIMGNSEEFPMIQKALPGGMYTPRRGKRLPKAAARRREKAGKPLMAEGDGELRRVCPLFYVRQNRSIVSCCSVEKQENLPK